MLPITAREQWRERHHDYMQYVKDHQTIPEAADGMTEFETEFGGLAFCFIADALDYIEILENKIELIKRD